MRSFKPAPAIHLRSCESQWLARQIFFETDELFFRVTEKAAPTTPQSSRGIAEYLEGFVFIVFEFDSLARKNYFKRPLQWSEKRPNGNKFDHVYHLLVPHFWSPLRRRKLVFFSWLAQLSQTGDRICATMRAHESKVVHQYVPLFADQAPISDTGTRRSLREACVTPCEVVAIPFPASRR